VQGHYDELLTHYGEERGLRIARKHIGWYSKGLPGSAEFRGLFNNIDSVDRAKAALENFYLPLFTQQAA
jgi:tRNA-dihydrouridine synthase B